MKFWEAVEEARETGCRIERYGDFAHWDGRRMIWDNNLELTVSSANLDADWQIAKPPPKEYTFAQALAMMEQGKRMKPMPNGIGQTLNGNGSLVDQELRAKTLHLWEVKAKWIEAE